MRGRRAFKLVELLVVIGIIALLISILLPSLSKAREQANTVACGSNLRQIGLAVRMYSDEWKGRLPPVEFTDASYTRLPDSNTYLVALNPYLGRKHADEAAGYTFMRCPSTDTKSGWADSYAGLYRNIFNYHVAGVSAAKGSAKLTRIPPDVMIMGDSNGTYHIYNGAYPGWEIDDDTDGDNIPDFSTGTNRFLNGWSARHSGKQGNILYADAHVMLMTLKGFVNNEGSFFGEFGKY